ncbi:hypothetical protein NQZ68_037148 [Dissostichus eleginoides]|nr:hypothetical protein NQZ68_037148 [Dissostichus eleginoides]
MFMSILRSRLESWWMLSHRINPGAGNGPTRREQDTWVVCVSLTHSLLDRWMPGKEFFSHNSTSHLPKPKSLLPVSAGGARLAETEGASPLYDAGGGRGRALGEEGDKSTSQPVT